MPKLNTQAHLVGDGKDSRQQRILDLEEGETYAMAYRIDMREGVDPDKFALMIRNMRGTLDALATRAKRRMADGRQYTVENGTFVANSGYLLAIVTITRLITI